ncbi:hypothetical protein P154DRAFT_168798 [Amniculicola lignicola CBS 123094]|uniref:Uncharacterized protein n=1 Tax=Amniculicola lignicola CBS 123094 TaxID=1392246 RepID=A0A6A5WUU9_9PLEO|nr:hypothetical protein P154DRAFT_168798 [Amniculicola lignicola CBS 123094]
MECKDDFVAEISIDAVSGDPWMQKDRLSRDVPRTPNMSSARPFPVFLPKPSEYSSNWRVANRSSKRISLVHSTTSERPENSSHGLTLHLRNVPRPSLHQHSAPTRSYHGLGVSFLTALTPLHDFTHHRNPTPSSPSLALQSRSLPCQARTVIQPLAAPTPPKPRPSSLLIKLSPRNRTDPKSRFGIVRCAPSYTSEPCLEARQRPFRIPHHHPQLPSPLLPSPPPSFHSLSPSLPLTTHRHPIPIPIPHKR